MLNSDGGPATRVSAASVKDLFQNSDVGGTGYMHTDDMIFVLCCLGMSESRSYLLLESFKIMEGLPDKNGTIAYRAFIDWLLDLRPSSLKDAVGPSSSQEEEAQLGIARGVDPIAAMTRDHGQGHGLRNLRRVEYALSNGHKLKVFPMVFARLDEFLDCEKQQPEVQTKMRKALRLFEDMTSLESGSEPVELMELTSDCASGWERFARWCTEDVLCQAFKFFDFHGKGKLSAQELMTFLMLLATNRSADVNLDLDPTDAESIVREFDVSGDGLLSRSEFLDMVHVLELEAGLWSERMLLPQPKLNLFFDVNNTVMLADTLTGAAEWNLISMTLAGCAWGMKTRQQGKDVWILVCQQPTALPPWEGLISYTEFIVEVCPMPKPFNKEEADKVKKWRREALQNFCQPGHPGEMLRPCLDRLVAVLKKDQCKLLPSFYSMLLKLARARKPFSLTFRTFGVDIDASVEAEFNKFCKGQHPLFPGGPLLDGSDGGPDLRMDLSDADSIGTFVRSEDNSLSLIWGTHKQPKTGKALEFYEDMPGVRIVQGTLAVATSLAERSRSTTRVTVLRDYYPGWSRASFSGKGGKAFFVDVADQTELPIFFDDHIRPTDPNIVDVIDVRHYPVRTPMAQVYDTHLVKANPLKSISDMDYFWDEVRRCEREKRAQLFRRRTVARMLHDVPAIRRVINLLTGEIHMEDAASPPPSAPPDLSRQLSAENAEAMTYTPFADKKDVKHATPFIGIS